MLNYILSYSLVILSLFTNFGLMRDKCMAGMDNHNTIKTREVALHNITDVSLSALSRGEFIRSDSNKVKMVGPEDQISKYSITTKGSELKISSKTNNHNDHSKVMVYVYTKDISSIDARALGNLTINNVLDAKRCHINMDAIGDCNITMNVEEIDCTIKAVSSVILNGKVQKGNLSISAAGSVNISNLNKGDVNMSMSAIGSYNK